VIQRYELSDRENTWFAVGISFLSVIETEIQVFSVWSTAILFSVKVFPCQLWPEIKSPTEKLSPICGISPPSEFQAGGFYPKLYGMRKKFSA
jgi:hypothetical protein